MTFTNASLRRLFISAALFVLPSVERALKTVERVVTRIDVVTDLIEERLRSEAIRFSELAAERRTAMDAIRAAYDAADKRQLDAIAASNAKLAAAADARDRVAIALNLR